MFDALGIINYILKALSKIFKEKKALFQQLILLSNSLFFVRKHCILNKTGNSTKY